MNRQLLLGASVLLLFVAASCADQTSVPPTSDRPDLIQIFPDHRGVQVLADNDKEKDKDDSGSAALRQATQASALIDPAVGGTVQAGRYTVVVPPLALLEPTTITVIVDEKNGKVGCELLPHGIVFATPVTFAMDLAGTNADALAPITIYWKNDASNQWVDVGGTYDPVSATIWTTLPHFSSYTAGRAGW